MLFRLALPLVLLLLMPGASYGERPLPEPRWTVQVDPLTTALGFLHVQTEYALSGHHSVYVGPHLRLFDGVFDDDEAGYRAYGVESAYRYFWQGQAPRGPWGQARLVASYLTRGQDTAPGGYISALGGYTWILQDRWVLALGLGVQYLQMRVGGVGSEGVFPAAHTALGVAF